MYKEFEKRKIRESPGEASRRRGDELEYIRCILDVYRCML